MSKIALTPNASGTGVFTIAAPNSNTDRTLTLPDVTGTILTNASNSNFPTGSVLQVVQTVKTDTYSTTSSSWVAVTGLSVSITPSSSSNKILVLVQLTSGSDAGTNGGGAFRLYRDGSEVTGSSGAAAGSRTTGFAQSGAPASSNWMVLSKNLTYLDSPASTSALSYQIYARAQNTISGTTVNKAYDDPDSADRVRLTSTITVMEIKA